MVKAYMRYEPAECFGVVSSSASNVVCDHDLKLVITPALEKVHVWNPKTGALVRSLEPVESVGRASGEVTRIARSPTRNIIAVGHSDGVIRIWDYNKGQCLVTLTGHKTAVSALRYNSNGSMLASGGKDTDIVLWDVVGETGLFRLRGHRDQVTDLVFLESARCVVSCSKDAVVRVWDLDTQHCVQTVVGHRGEVWALAVDPQEQRLVTGSVDQQLRLYAVQATSETLSQKEGVKTEGQPEKRSDILEVLTPLGSLQRQSNERVVTLEYDATGELLGCQPAGKSLELYRVRSGDELQKRAKRRKKRLREKVAKKGSEKDDDDVDLAAQNTNIDESVSATDELQLLQVLRLKNKVRSFAFYSMDNSKAADAMLAIALHNNTIEVHEVNGKETSKQRYGVELPGHRNDVRALALSSDDSMLLSCSHTATKIWNPRSGVCLRTMESGYGLSAMFVPGNRQAIIGTKEGTLELFDVGSATCYHVEEAAHEGAVWSLASLADDSGFVSGSADHAVKFWEYELEEKEDGVKRLMIRHTRTLQMTEDVMCVKFDPKGKLLATAVLDSTIKVFFTDSLKFFLSLYGHKLPVLSMDISSDGTLLASGSADKNIKIWGMDFGDCHKSIFAHNDSVMQVKFVRKTHYLFSAGKDKVIKYWDCDKFEPLLTLQGHKAEVWSLAISSFGDFIMTGSHDRSIRRWEKTDEPFFIEEEQEKQLDSMFEEGLEKDPQDNSEVPEEGVVGIAGTRSLDTLTSADAIMEALELVDEEAQRQHAHQAEHALNPAAAKPLPPNALLLGLSPSDYVLRSLKAVRTSDLEQTLLVLPFTTALNLIPFLVEWLQKQKEVELVSRTATLMMKVHQAQLVGTASARPSLLALHKNFRPCVQEMKDIIGVNIAAIKQLQHMVKNGNGFS